MVRKRTQGATERDLAGLEARALRDAAAPEYVFEGDITSQYEGEELDQHRADAFDEDPKARVTHLEKKVDLLQAELLKRADQSVARAEKSVDFGRGLAWKIVVTILGAITIIATAFAAGRFTR